MHPQSNSVNESIYNFDRVILGISVKNCIMGMLSTGTSWWGTREVNYFLLPREYPQCATSQFRGSTCFSVTCFIIACVYNALGSIVTNHIKSCIQHLCFFSIYHPIQVLNQYFGLSITGEEVCNTKCIHAHLTSQG